MVTKATGEWTETNFATAPIALFVGVYYNVLYDFSGQTSKTPAYEFRPFKLPWKALVCSCCEHKNYTCLDPLLPFTMMALE